jgi:biotin carboxyl carrier protein
VPADLLAALLQQESGFNPNARSPAGALGIAQFMPGTARGMGVDPLNPQSAIPGAARYLANAIAHNHGNVRLALASYNAGQGAVDRYGGIPPYAETQHYVQAVLAGRSRFPVLASGQVPVAAGGVPTATPPTSQLPATPTQASALVTMPNPAYTQVQSIQDLITQNAQNAHIPGLTLPLPPLTIQQPQTTTTPTSTQTPTRTPTAATQLPRGAIDGRSIYTRANLGRTDQGVDFTGAGTVTALADGVVTRVVPHGGPSGWPGGGFIVYRITSGPHAGQHVFAAENITPTVRVGQQIRFGQPIAIAHGGRPWTETGWAANASGTTLARATTGYHEGEQTPAGKSFLAYLHSLGLV